MIILLLYTLFSTAILTFVYSKILKLKYGNDMKDETYRKKVKKCAIIIFALSTIVVFVGICLIPPSFL